MVALLLVLLAGLGAGGLLLAVRGRAVSVPPQAQRLAEVQRSTRRWRSLGLLAGVTVAVVVALQGGLGRGLLLACPLFGICVLGGVVAGELRVPAPAGPTRRAPLEVRSVGDYLPSWLGLAVAASALLFGVALVAGTATASPDDLGRAGRALVRQCSSLEADSAGPWPGSYYSYPLFVAVLAGAVPAMWALRRIVRRPRQDEDTVVDDALRRQTGEAVVAATGVLFAVPAAGLYLMGGSALLRIGCRPAWWAAAGWAAILLLPELLALVAWCTAVLVAPMVARRGPHPPAPAQR
jgi:hypothetical protein